MNRVKIVWLPESKGGRKTIPPAGKYYAVSRFKEDKEWPNNAWSVVFEIDECEIKNNEICSLGTVRFLMDTAPESRLESQNKFEIYEVLQKVAYVYLIHN